MGRILNKLKRARLRSLYRGDHRLEGERSVENTDALAAAGGRTSQDYGLMGNPQAPPGYVKTDDGRPRN